MAKSGVGGGRGGTSASIASRITPLIDRVDAAANRVADIEQRGQALNNPQLLRDAGTSLRDAMREVDTVLRSARTSTLRQLQNNTNSQIAGFASRELRRRGIFN